MPLHTDNRQIFMHNAFGHAIRRILNHRQAPPRGTNALMMRAVHIKICAVQLMKYGSGNRMAGMDLIPAVILMCIISGQILYYAAAEINIDNLHALTNPQDRPGKANKSIQHGKLLPVKPRFNFPGSMVALSKQNRIDIAAPGKKQCVKIPGKPAVCRNSARSAAALRQDSERKMKKEVGLPENEAL